VPSSSKTIGLDAALTLTRRRLVLAAGAGAAALYLDALPAAARAATAPAYLRRASYVQGTRFKTPTATGTTVTLTLTSVADLVRARTEPALRGRDDAFTLMFSGPATPVLPAAVRRIRHPTLGWVSLFAAPVGRASGSQAYEVVVDRRPR
jgi:hypothetical protein